MNTTELLAIVEATKDAMQSAYEGEDKASAGVLAKSLAALDAAIATQIGSQPPVA